MTKTASTSGSQHRHVENHDINVPPGGKAKQSGSTRGKKVSSSAGEDGLLSRLKGWMPGQPKRATGNSPRAKGKLPVTDNGAGGEGVGSSGSASSSRRSDASADSFHDASSCRSDASSVSSHDSFHSADSHVSSASSHDSFHSFSSDTSSSFETAPSSPHHTPPPTPRREPQAPPVFRNIADVGSNMPHPSPKLESTQTSSLFGRVSQAPGKGMHLPISGEVFAKAPASTRGTPLPPGVSAGFAKGLLNSDHHKMQKTIRNAVTQIAPEVPKPAMTDKPAEPMPALTDRAALEAEIGEMFPLPGPGSLQAMTNPHRVQNALFAALGRAEAGGSNAVHVAAPTQFTYTNHVLVAEDLALACGGDALRAEAALGVLTSGPAMEQTLQHLDAGTLSGASLDALHTAATLASTAGGFNALMTMMRPAPAPERQAGLQRLLTAVGQVAQEGADAGIANALAGSGKRASLRVTAAPARATLAEKVLSIELRMHKAPAVAGAASPYAALTPAEKTSVFSWKQGFRESGPGTELSKAQGRLAKMGKYVARAAKHEKNASAAFDFAHPLKNGKFVKARARMTAASVNQVFGKKKSPLSPMRSLGVNNAALMHPDDDVINLDQYVGTAMDELGKQLAPLLPDAGSPQHQAMQAGLADRNTPLPQELERTALMAYLQNPADQVTPRRPIGNTFDAAALASIADRIAVGHGVPDAAATIAAKLGHWNGHSVGVSDLRKWGAECGLLESVATAHADGGAAVAGEPPTLSKETAFGKALRQAENTIDPARNRPAAMTADGAHQYVRTFVQEASWGNVVTAGSGGAVGVNVAPLTVGLRKVAGKITGLVTGGVVTGAAGPIADVRGVRSHSAQISFGTSHHGGELFLGTQKQGAGALGGGFGASIRAGFAKVLSAQAGASATVTPLAGDKGYTRGVMVRTLRPENADGMTFNSALARDDMVRFIDFAFGMAKAEGGERQAPEQSWEKIANEFFDSPTLSIGWHNQSAETLRHTSMASGNLRAGVVALHKPYESIGIGGTLTVSTDWASAANNKRTENTGAYRMVRNNHNSRLQVNLTAGAAITSPSIPVDNDEPGPTLHIVTPDDQRLSFQPDPGRPTTEVLNAPVPLLGKQANLSLVDQGMNVTFRALVENGRLSETYTLREVEHRDAGHFKAMLQEPSRQAQYEKVFEAVHGADKARDEMDKFITKLDKWAGPGQHYSMRSRIRSDVRRGLDESAALATTIHRRNPEDPRLAQISAHMMAQLNDERSWVPMQIQAFEAQSASDVAGLNFGAVATSNFTLTSDRELYATAAPPNMIRAWADLPPPAAPVRPEGG